MVRPGAGHFVKMVHNGVEYGIMQYTEGLTSASWQSWFQIRQGG